MTAPSFSKAPQDALTTALSKGYVALHVEQGVPVLDRDLNLLGDLISSALQRIVRQHIGDGVSGTADFAIQANGNPLDFTIGAGSYLAAGRLVTLPSATTYRSQVDPATGAALPPLTAAAAARVDTVYLDVWTAEIDDSADPDLGNGLDIGLRTSTRTRVLFVVRVAENAPGPPAVIPAGHAFIPLAQLNRAAGGAVGISDLRLTRLSMAQVVQRMAVIEQVLAPSITSVSPNSVLPGQRIPMTVAGNNLNLGGAIVTLGDVPAVVNDASTATALIVEVPAAAVPGAQTLIVQTMIGTASAPLAVTVQAPPPPPTFATDPVAPIVPNHAPTGSQIVLNGSHFTGVNRVTFNATPAVNVILGGDLVSVTDAVITVNVPSALAGAAGSAVTLTVSADGVRGMTATSTALFTIDPPPVVAPKFGPSGSQIATNPATNPVTQAHGGQVILRGSNFGTLATTAVSFFGTNTAPALATDLVSVSATSITVKVPASLTVAAAPNNQCRIAVTVGGVRVLSDDSLLVTP